MLPVIFLCIYRVYILSLLFDVTTTLYGFITGHPETNPLFNSSMKVLGYEGDCPPLRIEIASLGILIIRQDLVFVGIGLIIYLILTKGVRISTGRFVYVIYVLSFIIILFLLYVSWIHIKGIFHNWEAVKTSGRCFRM